MLHRDKIRDGIRYLQGIRRIQGSAIGVGATEIQELSLGQYAGIYHPGLGESAGNEADHQKRENEKLFHLKSIEDGPPKFGQQPIRG